MNAPDVYLDNFHTRTFSIIRLRNRFSRLAGALILEQQEEEAIKVLDYCMELTPHDKIPYDPYLFQIIEQYYQLKETEKATVIMQKYFELCDEYLQYYTQFDDTKLNQITEDIKRNFHYLYNLSNLANKFGQQEMADQIQTKLNAYYQVLGPKIQE
jgi:hypothetical protein